MNYELKRLDRKTLALEITRDLKVLVRAPLLMSMREINEFVNSNTEWINNHLEKMRQRQRPEPTEDQIVILKKKAKEYLPKRIEYYSNIMGVIPTSVKITSARTRFGSCNGKNGICFSWRLMQYPDEAIDYVVVHELAHIRHKNHSKAFYNYIEEIMPDYRERKKLLS